MKTRLLKITLLLAGISLLPACLQLEPKADPTRYYLLSGSGETGELAQPEREIAIQLLAFPDYARRAGLAVRHGEHEIRYAPWHQWAEEPEDEFFTAFAAALEAEIPSLRVVRWGLGKAAVPEAPVLRIEVERFEGEAAGHAHLAARWQLAGADGEAENSWHRFRQSQSWTFEAYPALVTAHSANIRAFAARVAEVL